MNRETEELDLFETTHCHHEPHRGELEAARKSGCIRETMQAHILERIRQAGPPGLTPDEYSQDHSALINTVRRRFTDLWKAGKIRHHPEELHRKNSAGNLCLAWVEGTDPDCELLRGRGLETRIRKLEERVERLTIEIAKLI